MKYYLIAGEASGDLHASRLMRALKKHDTEAQFRYFGGDLMAAEGGTLVRHYRELAYMGFVPVLMHLPTIMAGMRQCRQDIAEWQPDVAILVDYPGFNLKIASFLRQYTKVSVYYYISPKIWAWKEWRIKRIKRDVDELFSILPFEVDFFEGKHHYPIHYVGNPTAEEVEEFKKHYSETFAQFCQRWQLDPDKKIIALLAGSRRQEIKDNLPAMVQAASGLEGCQLVLAGAPSIDTDYYAPFIGGKAVSLVRNDTYALLSHAHAALVTSGTATLETALFRVPQVVCYETPLPRLVGLLRRRVLSVRFVSLVNLIADSEVVPELVAETFTVANIRRELLSLLAGDARRRQLDGYDEVARRLGTLSAPDKAARLMVGMRETPLSLLQ